MPFNTLSEDIMNLVKPSKIFKAVSWNLYALNPYEFDQIRRMVARNFAQQRGRFSHLQLYLSALSPGLTVFKRDLRLYVTLSLPSQSLLHRSMLEDVDRWHRRSSFKRNLGNDKETYKS